MNPGRSTGGPLLPNPGSSLTTPARPRIGLPPLATQSAFSLVGKAAMKMAAQIAEEWTVGPIMASHLTNGGDEALIQPFFNSKLPYQHITPFLTDINDVRDPFRFEFMAILETDVNGGPELVAAPDFERLFQDAFERRRPPNLKKIEGAEEPANELSPGLFQRFIDRRRNVRGDRVGKPLAKFIAMVKEATPAVSEEHGVWRLKGGEKVAGECFFFTRPGAKELFKDVFNAPLVNNRMVVTTTQLAMLDVAAMMSGAGRKAKGKGHESQVLAIATELAEDIASVGGHPCNCCWSADVGGLGDDGLDAAGDPESGDEGHGREKDDGGASNNTDDDDEAGGEAENEDEEGDEHKSSAGDGEEGGTGDNRGSAKNR